MSQANLFPDDPPDAMMRKYRARHGISQQQLAQELKIHVNTVQNIERRRVRRLHPQILRFLKADRRANSATEASGEREQPPEDTASLPL